MPSATRRINDEVDIIASQAVEDLKRSGATVFELNARDLDSRKLSSDISVSGTGFIRT